MKNSKGRQMQKWTIEFKMHTQHQQMVRNQFPANQMKNDVAAIM